MVSEDSDLHKEIQVDLVKNVTGQYTRVYGFVINPGHPGKTQGFAN